jgi:hypothetical protein
VAIRLRSCILLAAGALGLHQLRYTLAYGGDAGHALRAQGHAYLGPGTAVVVGALILALALGLRRLAAGHDARRGRTLAGLWLAAAGALLAVYAVQETIEGAVAPGHAGGIAALAAHGGWVALPLAAALGLLIALGMRGRRAAAEALAVAARAVVRWARAVPARAVVAPREPAPRRLGVLAAAAAGRAPPAAS